MDKRISGLDLLKIIATVMIIFHHYQQITGAWWGASSFYGGLFYYGELVELFFIISGFIMYRYIEKIKFGLSFKKYCIHRFFRFIPLMAICVIVTTVFAHLYIILYGEVFFNVDSFSLWTILISSLGIQEGWFATNVGINNPAWYISVLLLCYVILYLLTFIAERLHISCNYLFGGMIFIGLGIQYYGINYPLFNYLSSRGYVTFFLGLLLAYVVDKRAELINFQICLTIIIIIPFLIYKQYWLVLKDVKYIMIFIFYPALIFVFSSQFVSKIMHWSWINNLANISFNAFMWHYPLLEIKYVVLKLFDFKFDLCTINAMIIFSVVCFGVGTLSYILIEKPLNRVINLKIN